MRVISLATLGLLSVLIASAAAHAADLRISVANLAPDTGHLMLAVYASGDSFDARDGAVEEIRKRVDGDTATLEVSGLGDGRYAIAAFQDITGDRELTTNLLGMPQEPWGFSRDAAGSMGPPAFEDAAFVIEGEAVEMAIRLNRP